MRIISYAQNLEDILLWRALGDVENGFYIDVGANDPIEDSVTKAFYDRGWSGINIEPIPRHYDDLTAQRPRDINLRVAAGDKKGEMEIADVPAIRGWATMDKAVAQAIEDSGQEVVRSKTPVRTLNDICAEHSCNEIHFLKIDVEGFEGRVIQGIDLNKIKPWVLLVEAYCVNKGRIDNKDWEPYVLGAGYKLAFFDGLNCFYVSKQNEGLLPLFDSPVNVLDDYIRHGHLRALESANAAERLLSKEKERFVKSTEEFQQQASQAEDRAVQAEAQAVQAEDRAVQAEALRRHETNELSVSLDEARRELREVHQSNHHHRLLAEARHDEILALRTNMSWRLTAPARWIAGPLHGKRRRETKVQEAKRFDRLIKWGMTRPRLVQFVHFFVDVIPPMRRFITRRVASTVDAPPPEIAEANSPVITHSTHNMTPHARQIHSDLVAAINEHHR